MARVLYYEAMMLFIIFFALLVRLVRFPELSWFYGDQGIDLMVAQRALKDDVWPMVGPYLHTPNFFVPPTYYGLLTFLLWVGRQPEIVTLYFVAMNVLALIFLYRIGHLLVDIPTGYIVAALYAVSLTAVDQGRSMWQPHPVQLFLVASLYFLTRSSLVTAWGLYGVALSIYPSPIALLPFYLYHSWRWVKGIRWVEWVRAVGFAVLAFFLPFVPWVIFEFWHGWPTYASFFSGSFGTIPWWDMAGQFALNIFGIVSEVFRPWSLHPRISVLTVPVVAILFGAGFVLVRARFGRDPQFGPFGRAFSFLSPFWLFVGFASLLLYREMSVVWHRLWGFMPFALLALAIMLRAGLRWRSVLYRAVIISLAGLYFLREIRDYPVPFMWAGNDLDRAVWGNDGRRYIFLLCKEYSRQEDIERTCLGTFAARSPGYRLEKRLLFDGDTTVFLFGR